MNVSFHYIPPLDSSSPALAFQVTSLVDSYMIWAGITEGNADDVHTAASKGRLTQEWACAMPSLKVLITVNSLVSYLSFIMPKVLCSTFWHVLISIFQHGYRITNGPKTR